MEMPKNCGSCRFSQIRYYADYANRQPDIPNDYKCVLTGEWLYDENDDIGNRNKIHQNCPLIAVNDESEEFQDCVNSKSKIQTCKNRKSFWNATHEDEFFLSLPRDSKVETYSHRSWPVAHGLPRPELRQCGGSYGRT